MRIMKFSQYVRLLVVSISVLMALPSNAEMSCESSSIVQQVTEQRHLFNRAIQAADIKTIESILAKDVQLVTGSDSIIFAGREQQLEVWLSDFNAGSARMIYTRTPTCISQSKNSNMALESGDWRGEDSSGKGFYGVYSAKWRLVEELKRWQLEAEIFMTVGELK